MITIETLEYQVNCLVFSRLKLIHTSGEFVQPQMSSSFC